MIKTGSNLPHFDPKWGRYKPCQRFNVDQVPLPFAIDTKTTYEEPAPKANRKDHKVHLAIPSSGLDKRQCSLQVCFSPVADKCRIAIIFRGKGKVTKDERLAYHKGVDVYFQKCAWVDREIACQWADKTFGPAIKDIDDGILLICDNLDGQTCDAFRKKIKALNGIVTYGPAGQTDAWQPVDSGFGRLLKILISNEQQDWLEHEQNMDKWLGNDDKKLSAKERRILLTHWTGEAFEKLKHPKYDHSRWKCFERTGCLITVDGSDDDKIKPEGMKDYIVPPPIPIPTGDDPFESVPEGEPMPEDTLYADDVIMDAVVDDDNTDQSNNENSAEDDMEEEVDEEEDRVFDHNLVGLRIKVFYDNLGDWFVGNVTWYNRKMKKLRLHFTTDDSDDYISEDMINGIDMILMS